MNDVSKSVNNLDTNTELAVTRTRLSADRTLMSWIRTSFSMISFGFTIIKFFQILKNSPQTATEIPQSSSGQLGLFLIILGLVSLLPATLAYRKELKALHQLDQGSLWTYTLFVAICVAIMGIYALVVVLTNRVLF